MVFEGYKNAILNFSLLEQLVVKRVMNTKEIHKVNSKCFFHKFLNFEYYKSNKRNLRTSKTLILTNNKILKLNFTFSVT